MQTTTQTAIKAILGADATITPPGRVAFLTAGLAALDGKPTEPANPTAPRILRRAEASRRLGIGLRMVDVLTRQGVLVKVRFPGRTRAAGFQESAITALIEGKGADHV